MALRRRRIVALYLLWQFMKSKRRLWVQATRPRRLQPREARPPVREPRLDDAQFRRDFRLTRRQFDDLLRRLGDRISHQDTNYRLSIPAWQRLSICLRYLSTGDSFRSIANCFHVGVSTVQKIVPEVSSAIWDCLAGDFMAAPSTDDWRTIAEDFAQRWSFPLCCGALDSKHVVLKCPPHLGTVSLVVIAVVDANYRFRLVDISGYGKTSDCGILANSAFGQALRDGSLRLPADRPLPGAEHRGAQPHVFVGSEAFPLRRNLMRPYPGRKLAQDKDTFNYRLSRARLVVENAFRILSSQWGMYRRVIVMRPEVVEKCVKATCVLHNFMMMTSEDKQPMSESLPAFEGQLTSFSRVASNNHSREAVRVRETFTEYFSAEGTVPRQQGSSESQPPAPADHSLQPQ
ncbi:uncharacterized protein ACB058_011334 [Synchiropus picturatus]